MKKRRFGNTELLVSEVGFGAWAIGGPAMVGATPIGWGTVNDLVSIKALRTAVDRGLNFFDTADFYGLGHSEELIGNVFGNSDRIIVASKVGHRIKDNEAIEPDYSQNYILSACERSLTRLKRESIDYYQLHSPRVAHLARGECIEAMELLKAQGKIRYWGLSLNTFDPFPEAEFMFKHRLGSGIQVALNIINQRAVKTIELASQKGYGMIARMPFQFGLLTGKFNPNTRFHPDDHRHFRLKPLILERAIQELEPVWSLSDRCNLSPTQLSLSFVLSFPEISTVIPGIKTPEQAVANTSGLVELDKDSQKLLRELYDREFDALLKLMEAQEK
ncbi:MAG: aldo/keto reductase [Xenococcaceae cyanobacterium MO_188.B32]|nr:aldo/keto reductase [Xenococcaceae cyanobacterium MO_188.B32]